MAYSAKAKTQNEQAAQLAKQILNELGFDPALERFGIDGTLATYSIDIRRQTIARIAAEIPDYPDDRIAHQVNRAMAQERGRAERRAHGVLNLVDASDESGIPVPTIRSAVLKGYIPGSQAGGNNSAWRIPRDAFEAWLTNRPRRGPKGPRSKT